MDTKRIIDDIRQQELFGTLVEVGAGCPVYNELCKHPNTASKLIKYAHSPNSLQYSREKYGTKDFRAVSAEVCHAMIMHELFNNKNPDTNFVLVNTIQIGNDAQTQTHGWFGLDHKTDNTRKYYHFTINNEHMQRSRPELIELISHIGLDILRSLNDCSTLENGYIDIILNDNFYPCKWDMVESSYNSLTNKELRDDLVMVFKRDGTVERFTEFLRGIDERNLAVFKGSFNPLHPHHIALIERLKDLINCKQTFMVSLAHREHIKATSINVENVLSRIAVINEMGYDVVVNQFPYFHDAMCSFTNHHSFIGMKLHFVMGDDVLCRFLEDEKVNVDREHTDKFNRKWEDVTFWYNERKLKPSIPGDVSMRFNNIGLSVNEISSSDIRERFKQNDKEAIKTLLGDKLYDSICKHYAW